MYPEEDLTAIIPEIKQNFVEEVKHDVADEEPQPPAVSAFQVFPKFQQQTLPKPVQYQIPLLPAVPKTLSGRKLLVHYLKRFEILSKLLEMVLRNN
jgi:hypothetical protein